MNGLIRYKNYGAVAAITLSRPEAGNGLTPELLDALQKALAHVRADQTIRVLVLQADGRHFCTGSDKRAITAAQEELAAYGDRLVAGLNQVMLMMLQLPQPIICAAQGEINGAGLGLLLASDIVYMDAEATITPNFNLVGFSPIGGWTALLPGRISGARAAHSLFTNQPINAREALEWGLAAGVFPAERVQQAAQSTAVRLGANMQSGSIAQTKSLLHADMPAISAALQREKERFMQQLQTAGILADNEAAHKEM